MNLKIGDRIIINGDEQIIENIVDDMVYLSNDFPIELKQLEQNKKGSGQRLDSGKINLADCPVGIQGYVAAVFMLNSKPYGGKYDHGNYLNGMKWSKVFNPMLRHIFKWLMGERLDKESGLPHLAHIAANIAILIEYEKIYPEGDDRLIKGQVTVDDVQILVDGVFSKRK